MAGRRALDRPLGWALLLLCAAGASTGTPSARAQGGVADALAAQVEVLRTAHGVPHIYADTFEALGYALGYLQVEDYGERVPRGLLRARGELALHEGRAALDADFGSQPYYRRAVEVYPALQQDTRDVYDGFAAGVNRYLAQHPEEFAGWVADPFRGWLARPCCPTLRATPARRPVRPHRRRHPRSPEAPGRHRGPARPMTGGTGNRY